MKPVSLILVQNPQGTNSNTRANPFGAMGGLGSMNPEMINTAMDMMRQNPDLLRSVLNMSPAFAGRDTSGVAEQVRKLVSWSV